MELDVETEVEARKSRPRSKLSTADRAARKVLAPFLRRIKKDETQDLISQVDNEYHKQAIRFKIRDVVSKFSSFCKDSLEVPTILNETSEILKEVTKSAGASSYIVDETNEYMTLNPKYMPRNSRHTVKYKVEPGKTVAAFVAHSQEVVMVHDVLGDVRFPLGIPGCKKDIKAVLCVPVLTTVDGNCVAVIELFRNANQEPYSALDLQICVSMTGWMGAAIHQNNQRLFLLKKSELSNYLTSLVEFFFAGALSFDKFVSDIIECAKLSTQAERGSFYVMEEEVKEGTEEEIVADVYEEGLDSCNYSFKKKNKQRFSKNSLGFVGHVARQGKTLNIQEAYSDPRFNPAVDLYGFLTRSVISVPLKGSLGVLGVLQLVNKLEEPYFTQQDEIVLQNIAGYAYLACQHGFLKDQLKKSFFRSECSHELLSIHMKPCSHDLRNLQRQPAFRKTDLPKGFFNFDWIITGKEKHAAGYAVFMFVHLLGEQFFDYHKLTEFILSVKKSYRDNPYHNFAHAFTVCHCMFNVLNKNKERFTVLQMIALMISTICHDSDHVGYTNNFLEITKHWLAELYWESPLEHHHFDITMFLIEVTGLLSHLSSAEFAETKKFIKSLILATDLVQLFRTRNQLVNLLKTKTFDWNNPNHRLTFLGIVMTVCDVSGQCKPFYSAKKVTEGLYREFYNQPAAYDVTPVPRLNLPQIRNARSTKFTSYDLYGFTTSRDYCCSIRETRNSRACPFSRLLRQAGLAADIFYNPGQQGDVEKSLGLTPLTMMDREKTSSIPENQIQFLSLICIPSVEVLVSVFPNTQELLRQCVELKDCWSDIQAKKIVEVWKKKECILPMKTMVNTKKVVLRQ